MPTFDHYHDNTRMGISQDNGREWRTGMVWMDVRLFRKGIWYQNNMTAWSIIGKY